MRAGVLGLGLGRHYVTAFNEDENVDEIILCDADINRINKIPTSISKIISAYTRLEDMLKAEKLDENVRPTPARLQRRNSRLENVDFEPRVQDLPGSCTVRRKADGPFGLPDCSKRLGSFLP